MKNKKSPIGGSIPAPAPLSAPFQPPSRMLSSPCKPLHAYVSKPTSPQMGLRKGNLSLILLNPIADKIFISTFVASDALSKSIPDSEQVLFLNLSPRKCLTGPNCFNPTYSILDDRNVSDLDVISFLERSSDHLQTLYESFPNHKIVVNCEGGCNRSVIAVIHFLASKRGWNPKKTLKQMAVLKKEAAIAFDSRNPRNHSQYSWPSLVGNGQRMFELSKTLLLRM